MTASTSTVPDVAQRVAEPGVPGMTNGAVRTWLRLEGLAAFAAGLALFAASGGNWLFLVPLLLLPDTLGRRLPGRAAGWDVHLQPRP